MKHLIKWFKIPVAKWYRAAIFSEEKMAGQFLLSKTFRSDDTGYTGSLLYGEGNKIVVQ